jgi:HPt (histidine-containing phosphotransfer) domain-containing protein
MTAILNHDRLEEVTSGDSALRATLSQLYLETLTRCTSALKSAASTGNAKAWQETLHELKGASANVGAEEMASLCMRMEYAASESWPEAIEELDDAAEAVQAAFEMLDE